MITYIRQVVWGLISQEKNAQLQRQLNFMKMHFLELTYFAKMTTEFSSPSTSHLRGEQFVPVCTYQPISAGDGRGRLFKLVTLHQAPARCHHGSKLKQANSKWASLEMLSLLSAQTHSIEIKWAALEEVTVLIYHIIVLKLKISLEEWPRIYVKYLTNP